MHKLFILALAAGLSFPAPAQQAPAPKGGAAQQEKAPLDADTLARIRTEGAAGGTGNPIAMGEGKKNAIRGKTNRRDIRPQLAEDARTAQSTHKEIRR